MKATVIDHSRNYAISVAIDDNPVGALRAAVDRHNPAAIEHRQVEIHCDQEFLDACLDGDNGAFSEQSGYFSHSFEDCPVWIIKP